MTAYQQRDTVERCINKLKQWRGLATRYDKTATVYLAALHIQLPPQMPMIKQPVSCCDCRVG
ncbi:hypothetical protein ACF1GT_35925 [Streptomyces sp. NPDC014636]|uniref:hypothetical protein n=1 Tax=Streptomyces sp. NPDC014636 TaxID=3364876 RepID=UPI0036F9B124